MTTRRDYRWAVLLLLVTGVAVAGLAVDWLPGRGVEARPWLPAETTIAPLSAVVDERFQRAAWLLHGHRYAEARSALEQLVPLAPGLPEVQVNLGFALLELHEYDQARQSFERAIDLRPMQVNAYFGLAEALERLGDLEAALGAMRTYTHLSGPDDPFRVRAEAAIWEWSATVSRDGAK